MFLDKGMREARRKKQQIAAPHVVMIIGAHVPGVEAQVKKVLDAEKPVHLGIEFMGSKESAVHNLRFMGQNAEELARGQNDPGYAARMLLLARRKHLSFDFIEKYPKEVVDHLDSQFDLLDKFFGNALRKAFSGEVEEALNLHKQMTVVLAEHSKIREPYLAAEIESQARNACGPIAVFLGSGHAPMIKLLVKNGVKVTLYHSEGFAPVTPILFTANLSLRAKRSDRIKHFLQEALFVYFRERYGLSEGEIHGIYRSIPGIARLRRGMPASEIEEFFHDARGFTPAQFRRHFVNFLGNRGVKLPSNDEMEELKKHPIFPEFRKVKIFEPKA